MTEERKYYTPEKQELHVGSEYEFRRAGSNEDWEPAVIKDCRQIDDIFVKAFNSNLNLYDIRVPYLDKQGIEELGWTRSIEMDTYLFHQNPNEPQSYELKIYPEGVVIYKTDLVRTPPVVFMGTLRNKSELKRIMRQTGITQ